METEKRNNFVRDKAAASTSVVSNWEFRPVGRLFVNDENYESYIGEVYYNNPIYEIGASIKVRNWVFCLERMTAKFRERLTPQNSPDVWLVAAFHEKSHYSFESIQANSQKELNNIFTSYVIEKFWPILHPESFDSFIKDKNNQGKDKRMTWQIVPL